MRRSIIFSAALAASLVSPLALAVPAEQHQAMPAAKNHALDDVINANGTAASSVAGNNWLKHIKFGALLNVDGYASSRDRVTSANGAMVNFKGDENHSAFFRLGNANLHAKINVNPYIDGYMNVGVNGNRLDNGALITLFREAYITVHSFSRFPMYVKAGRAYSAFGNYTPNALMPTVTQTLSQSRSNVLEVGFANESGLFGSAFGQYDNTLSQADDNSTQRVRTWGGKVGYVGKSDGVGFHINGSYINDFRAIDVFAAEEVTGTVTSDRFPDSQHGVVALHGDAMTGPFGLVADYVSQLTASSYTDGTGTATDDTTHRPWALSLLGQYHFKTGAKPSTLSVGFERTGKADVINNNGSAGMAAMPETRYRASYDLELYRNVTFTAMALHAKDYDLGADPRVGHTTNLAAVRLSVRI